MSDGVIVEYVPLSFFLLSPRFDTPLNLFDNENGIFNSMCQQSGIRREDIVSAEEN